MIEIRKTSVYERWFRGLRDVQAKARINARLVRLANNNPGDCRAVGEGVLELRIDYGPGYRVYFIRHESTLAVLLAGGDKSTQTADIQAAHSLARQWGDNHGA